ncbi:hypothetical protein KDN34_11225 [Shewanella yunxiaonensis]|uniref:Lipoprotein n=1 Tax=Shewanella yunxiaonensis TaxID=2829809 RepID=A0ABX7YQ28_9GAMM|nr:MULTISPECIES: hypothetical protein [Shewanella]MDF0534781.1 hypothetical protein [Shewanella sp. A32]QUN04817.1 hypothetical protein KDN34_11225 [Shewanella yunxiaonensis]
MPFLSGCASSPDDATACGIVSTYAEPVPAQEFYRLVVTHVDGKPVISKPNYQLSPGMHTFRVSELIDAPELKVRLAARVPKDINVKVQAGQRYQLAAKFNTDRQYSGDDTGYWQPQIRSQESAECELPTDN